MYEKMKMCLCILNIYIRIYIDTYIYGFGYISIYLHMYLVVPVRPAPCRSVVETPRTRTPVRKEQKNGVVRRLNYWVQDALQLTN